jgi:tRNA pseudouridine55 synthase
VTRRGATKLAGILPIDKPAGITSHDVVAAVRRATGEGRVGHAGTLDPSATGLLVLLIGPYARLAPYLSGVSKRYEARIAFGMETDTDDADGTVTRTALVPDLLFEPEAARERLAALIGASEQTPPAYSAIKVAGRVAHREARSGRPMELVARAIEVHEAELIGVDIASRTWDVAFLVSKGTYIRALARDIGRVSGSAAHLAALRRTQSGRIRLEDARTLEEVREAAAVGNVAQLFADPLEALGLPRLEADAHAIGAGGRCASTLTIDLAEGSALAVTVNDRLAGVYRVRGRTLVPEVVLDATGGAA